MPITITTSATPLLFLFLRHLGYDFIFLLFYDLLEFFEQDVHYTGESTGIKEILQGRYFWSEKAWG